jgi:hypothetical protein
MSRLLQKTVNHFPQFVMIPFLWKRYKYSVLLMKKKSRYSIDYFSMLAFCKLFDILQMLSS